MQFKCYFHGGTSRSNGVHTCITDNGAHIDDLARALVRHKFPNHTTHGEYSKDIGFDASMSYIVIDF